MPALNVGLQEAMMTLTSDTLILIDSRAARNAAKAADALNLAFKEFRITSPDEQAGLIGVCTVETGGFNVVSENLNYSTAAQLCKVWPSKFKSDADAAPYIRNPERLANKVYAGGNGNGPEVSGDGWRYRGRGYIQITGKRNYAACLTALYGRPDADPELLLSAEGAARSAAWFWTVTRCGQALRTGGMDAVTRIVNGPRMLGAKERNAYYQKALILLKGASNG